METMSLGGGGGGTAAGAAVGRYCRRLPRLPGVVCGSVGPLAGAAGGCGGNTERRRSARYRGGCVVVAVTAVAPPEVVNCSVSLGLLGGGPRGRLATSRAVPRLAAPASRSYTKIVIFIPFYPLVLTCFYLFFCLCLIHVKDST